MATLAPIQRFFQPGITVVRFCPAIIDINAPTRVELTAGTTFTKHVRGQEGFTVSSGQLETPDMASRFVSKIGGMISAEDSSLSCYGARDGVDVRSVFERDDEGFIVMQYGGDVEDNPMDVFPVTVTAVPPESSMEAAFGIKIQFSITSEPAQNVPTPALV